MFVFRVDGAFRWYVTGGDIGERWYIAKQLKAFNLGYDVMLSPIP